MYAVGTKVITDDGLICIVHSVVKGNILKLFTIDRTRVLYKSVEQLRKVED